MSGISTEIGMIYLDPIGHNGDNAYKICQTCTVPLLPMFPCFIVSESDPNYDSITCNFNPLLWLLILLLDLKIKNMNMITVFEILFPLMILFVNLRNMYDLIC